MVKVVINGFGRIGRSAFKIAFERRDVEIIAINDPNDNEALAQLLQFDSSYGIYDRQVTYDTQNLIIDGHTIPCFHERDPLNLPWKKLGVDVVMECSGHLNEPDQAKKHIKAGARKVVLSAPAKKDPRNTVRTVVLGVNDDAIKDKDVLISNASCTTNCIAPVMKVLEDTLGIEKALMTTVHSYTASQKLQDAPAKDLRESRAAAENIIPTTTGASKSATLTIPSLKGKFDGLSIRVPTPVVSLADITAVTKKKTTIAQLNKIFKKAAEEPYYQGILDVTERELVSCDFKGDPHSAIVDLPLTNVVGGNLIKIVAWSDNEWGYSNRLVELAVDFGKDK